MSTATNAALVALVAASCGPSFGTQTYWIQSNTTARNYQEKKCNEGDNDSCYYVGLDYLEYPTDSKHKDWVDHTYKLDPAKGKAYLQRTCRAKTLLSGNACGVIADRNLETVDEMLAECASSNQAMCDAIALSRTAKLTDDQYLDLCQNHTSRSTCSGAIARSNAHYDELMVIDYLDQLRADVALHLKSDDDDDDAPAASSDSACHKDTDCKRDRICQAGDCVDPKAAAAAPKAPEGPFKQADCDAFAALYDAHIANCQRATLGGSDLKHDMETVQEHWPKVPKDRYESLGARCSTVVNELEPKLKKAGC